MSEAVEKMNALVQYAESLKGDEKGEAQVFCDRLFQAFGHDGYKEAGATLEFRIKKQKKSTSFADLVWKPRVLVEMKRRGENLYHHYKQAFDYWIHAVPNRPRYVVLCNFDEFWIFDFDKQIDDPVDVVGLSELPKRYTALNFLFPEDPAPVFGNDREAVSREAADQVALLFKSLIERDINRSTAQRFVLQLVVAMFAEDIDLLPANTVYRIVDDCLEKDQNSYDLFKGLFEQMNSPTPAKAGRYKDIPYFNGGLFSTVESIELTNREMDLLGGSSGASSKDWSRVNPAIFGTIFQQSMDARERHAYGAHFTSEADILRVVTPTIVTPWRSRIEKETTKKGLLSLRSELLTYKVLDPACGSGNFLYVAYRELVRLEILLLNRIRSEFSEKEFLKKIKSFSLVSPQQFYGIDRDSFGVELAKVTLMLAKKLALDEARGALEESQIELDLSEDEVLPLENLNSNFICGDALFTNWPNANAIVGNPPYQSKNKLQQELGRAYVNELRDRYPGVDGRADYCVYWFRRAHDYLEGDNRAGLVGTNTIRQNYSREGGLDYIVQNGGEIVEAVSSMTWSGDASVDVSIVSWIKGHEKGQKRLYMQEGADPSDGWRYEDVKAINSSLSFGIDVSEAETLDANAEKGGCFQGQTHGHKGFLVNRDDAEAMLVSHPEYADVLHPYLIANELLGGKESLPSRYVIDLQEKTRLEAQEYAKLFKVIESEVLPDRQKAADEEAERNEEARSVNPKAKINHHHSRFLEYWWKLSYPRKEMIDAIRQLPRYIVCGRVTLRPIFEFISSEVNPNDALMVFPYEDDYTFGILQSSVHWLWFTNRCSTLAGRFRYTSNTVFDSFPWPQNPSKKRATAVAIAARELRALRRDLMKKHGLSLRDLYRSIEGPGAHPIKDAQAALDQAVMSCYEFAQKTDLLKALLTLNWKLHNIEAGGTPIFGPGLPEKLKSAEFITNDSLHADGYY